MLSPASLQSQTISLTKLRKEWVSRKFPFISERNIASVNICWLAL